MIILGDLVYYRDGYITVRGTIIKVNKKTFQIETFTGQIVTVDKDRVYLLTSCD